jgi:hypothetical protein
MDLVLLLSKILIIWSPSGLIRVSVEPFGVLLVPGHEKALDDARIARLYPIDKAAFYGPDTAFLVEKPRTHPIKNGAEKLELIVIADEVDGLLCVQLAQGIIELGIADRRGCPKVDTDRQCRIIVPWDRHAKRRKSADEQIDWDSADSDRLGIFGYHFILLCGRGFLCGICFNS